MWMRKKDMANTMVNWKSIKEHAQKMSMDEYAFEKLMI